MAYIPETPFPDGKLVYNLKQDGWDRGKPRMTNDVWIPINTPEESRLEIAKHVADKLNEIYKTASVN